MGPTDTADDDRSGPMEYNRLDDFDAPLLDARDRYPQFDIFRLRDGYVAVPAGAVIFSAIDIPGLIGKLELSIRAAQATGGQP